MEMRVGGRNLFQAFRNFMINQNAEVDNRTPISSSSSYGDQSDTPRRNRPLRRGQDRSPRRITPTHRRRPVGPSRDRDDGRSQRRGSGTENPFGGHEEIRRNGRLTAPLTAKLPEYTPARGKVEDYIKKFRRALMLDEITSDTQAIQLLLFKIPDEDAKTIEDFLNYDSVGANFNTVCRTVCQHFDPFAHDSHKAKEDLHRMCQENYRG